MVAWVLNIWRFTTTLASPTNMWHHQLKLKFQIFDVLYDGRLTVRSIPHQHLLAILNSVPQKNI